MQLAYQQTQSIPTPTTTNTHNSTINTHTSSSYVADYTLFVKNTLEMTEKQLASTRKKTIEANTTSNINSSTTTSTKRKKKYSPPTTSATTSITTTADNNNSNTALPTINSESPLTPHTHTQSLIGADLLSIPRIGTKAVAALLAYIGSTTGRRIVEELLVEVKVRPYPTTTGTTGTGIGISKQQQQQVNEVMNKGMISTLSTDLNQLSSDAGPDISTTTTIASTVTTAPSTSPSDNLSKSDSGSKGSIWSTSTDSNGNTITTVTSGNRHSNNRPFVGEVIVFTGKLESMSRAQAGALCERLGKG